MTSEEERIKCGLKTLQFLKFLLFIQLSTHLGASLELIDSEHEDYLYSLPSLIELARKEMQLVKLISSEHYWNIRKSNTYGLQFNYAVRSYVNTYDEEFLVHFKRHNASRTEPIKVNFRKALNDPVIIFQMFRRISKDMRRVYNFYNKTDTAEGNTLPDAGEWPTSYDFNAYVSRLVKLIEFYQLDALEFAGGLHGDKRIGVPLLPYHAVDLAFNALEKNRFATAVDMMAYGYTAILGQNVPMSTVDVFRDALNHFIYRHDQAWRFREKDLTAGIFTLPVGSMKNFFTYHSRYRNDKIHDLPMAREVYSMWSLKLRPSFPGELEYGFDRLRRLCMGESFQNQEIRKQLFCEHSLIGIMPYGFEWLSLDPGILLIHNFLRASETKLLRLQAAQQGNLINGTNFPESKSGDMQERIAQRLELLTSKDMQYRLEDLYVESFSPAHFFNVLPVEANDILDTGCPVLVLYLNNVMHGGRTVFYLPGISIQPEIHSAVFYAVSVDQDILRNMNVFHIGCPVMFGHKITATGYMQVCIGGLQIKTYN